MIGTGIFATLGIQVEYLKSTNIILILWFLGGVYALCGAVVYGALAKYAPRNGGEYHFLRILIHPSLGFSGGLLSIVTGFAAPLAITAIACASYFQNIFTIENAPLATTVLIVVAFIHVYNFRLGINFHLTVTVLKILALLTLIGLGIWKIDAWEISFSEPLSNTIFNSSIAIAFVYTLYAYSGWNAACYVIDEVKQATRSVAQSLIAGTLLVTLLYLATNTVFVLLVPIESLAGQIDIGHVFIAGITSSKFAMVMDVIIGMMLISSISAMLITGSRVIQTMASDFTIEISTGNSVLVLLVIALVLLFSFTFNAILLYTGFTLTIFLGFVSVGLMINYFRGKVKLSQLQFSCLIFFFVINISLIIYLTVFEMETSMVSWGAILIATLFYFIPFPRKILVKITALFES